MTTFSNPNGECPANPFMGSIKPAMAVAQRKRIHAAEYETPYDRAMLDELPTLSEKVRFLRESGLEFADFGLSNWVGGTSADAAVQLHQAVFGTNHQANGRAQAIHGASEYLTTKQFRKGYGALAFANSFGEVLSTFISISWSTVEIIEPDAVMEAQKRYLELLRKWLQHRDIPPAWVWVIENGKTYGLHSHILVRVPYQHKEQLAFQVDTAVATIAGRPVKKRRRGTKGDKTVHVIHRRDDNVRAQWRVLRYLMKGLKPTKRAPNPELREKQVAWQKVVGRKLTRQGLVVHQRFGVSRGLNTKLLNHCRRVAGLPPNALERGETEPAMLYTDEYVRDWHASQAEIYEAEGRVEHERMEAELIGSLNI